MDEHERSENGQARRHWRLAIGLTALAALLVQAYWYRRYVCDDAYITLRYARRLLDGHGLTWTDGERVEGYCNLSWLLGCALLGRFGVDLVDATRVLGVAFMSLALWTIARTQRTVAAYAIAAFSFAFAGPIAVWTVGGLEPPMVAAFLALSIAATLRLIDDESTTPLTAGLPLAGLALTRPDGMLLVALVTLSFSRSRVLELAPAHWRQTLQRPDVQQRLDANIYRRATLAPVADSRGAGNAAR